MSIKLASDEVVLKDYAYANVKAGQGLFGTANTSKNLIITNKRIIHREVSSQIGAESISNTQIPFDNIKSVDVTYGKKSHNIFLIWGILSLFASIMMFIAGGDTDSTFVIIMGVVLVLFAAFLIFLYFYKKVYAISCDFGYDKPVSVDHHYINSVATSSIFGLFFKRRKKGLKVVVEVDKDVAKEMAEEIGALILDVIAGVYDQKAAN